jgi:hypothetical protein
VFSVAMLGEFPRLVSKDLSLPRLHLCGIAYSATPARTWIVFLGIITGRVVQRIATPRGGEGLGFGGLAGASEGEGRDLR